MKRTSKNKKIKRTLKKRIRGGSAVLRPLARPPRNSLRKSLRNSLRNSPRKSPSLQNAQARSAVTTLQRHARQRASRRRASSRRDSRRRDSRRRSASLRRIECDSKNEMTKPMIDLPTNNIDIFATLKLDSESLLDNLINSGHIDNSHSARKVAESLISPTQTSFRDMGYISTMGSASKLYNTGRSVMPVLEPLGAALVASALIFNISNVWNKSINESTNNFINCKINLSLNINRSNKCGNLIAKETLLAAWSNLERILNVKKKKRLSI